jgi:uncharacterized protein (UPF0262 family)
MTRARTADTNRIVAVTLDKGSIGHTSLEVEYERAVAIDDLVEENSFAPVGHAGGPYSLHIRVAENLDVRLADDTPVVMHLLSLNPFKRVVKDYFLVCDSYYAAIKNATPERIEALDMGRRALHDEGSRLLQERIKHRIEVDFNTARRLFTLVCALHWRG